MDDPRLARQPPRPRAPDEPFHAGGEPLASTLLDHWTWASSDLFNNIDRAVVAEFIVGMALHVNEEVRDGWAPHDWMMPEGITVEVKATSKFHSWAQRNPSKPIFRIKRAQAPDPTTGSYEGERRRHAAVYVFAVLRIPDEGMPDPLDVEQWSFFVVATSVLDEAIGDAKSISLPTIRAMDHAEVGFKELRGAVLRAGSQTPDRRCARHRPHGVHAQGAGGDQEH